MKLVHSKYIKMTAVIWLGCFVMLSFIYILVLAPQKKLKKQAEETLADQKHLYGQAVIATQSGTVVNNDKQIKSLMDKFSTFATDSENLPDITFEISQMAGERQLDQPVIKTADNGRYCSIPNNLHIAESQIRIKFKSDFRDFAGFINELERHKPVIFVDSFSIIRSPDGDSNHSVNMNMSVFVRQSQQEKSDMLAAYGF